MSITDKKPAQGKAATTVNTSYDEKVKTDPNQIAEFDQLKELIGSEETKNSEVVENIDDQRQAVSAQELKERETNRVGKEEYYKLRNKWSWFICTFVAFMLLFQLFMVCAIGFKWVDFKDYQTFLHLVIGQNFAQIIGMGIIVAKFLFPNTPSNDKPVAG